MEQEAGCSCFSLRLCWLRVQSEAEIATYSVDEKLTGLDRLRFFLFNKNATSLQRQVGLDSVLRECTVRRPRAKLPLHRRSGSDNELNAARSAEGALAYAVAAASTSALAAPAVPSAVSAATSGLLEMTDEGTRLLEQLLPELHRNLPMWEWELQTKVAALYCELLSARLLPRARLLEPVLLPFLLRMLEQDEMSEDYLAVWLQPLLAAIDALGASSPNDAATDAAPVPASPLLSTTILDFSLKKTKGRNNGGGIGAGASGGGLASKDSLLSQPINVRILCVHMWGQLAKHLPWKTVQESVSQSRHISARLQKHSRRVTLTPCRISAVRCVSLFLANCSSRPLPCVRTPPAPCDFTCVATSSR